MLNPNGSFHLRINLVKLHYLGWPQSSRTNFTLDSSLGLSKWTCENSCHGIEHLNSGRVKPTPDRLFDWSDSIFWTTSILMLESFITQSLPVQPYLSLLSIVWRSWVIQISSLQPWWFGSCDSENLFLAQVGLAQRNSSQTQPCERCGVDLIRFLTSNNALSPSGK